MNGSANIYHYCLQTKSLASVCSILTDDTDAATKYAHVISVLYCVARTRCQTRQVT